MRAAVSTYVMPARKWGDEQAPEVPRAVVLVSSRDGAPVPHVAGAVRLAKALGAAGWTVRATYALAEVPDTTRRAAHQLASVGVRFARMGERGWACWYEVDGGGWRFSAGYLGVRRMGLRELTKALFEVTS